MKSLYLIGSLRNMKVRGIAKEIRQLGFDVYDDWHSPGPEADDWWQKYERERGRSYKEALYSWHAKQVFEHDKKHLDRCNGAVLVMPAGRSCHLEAGYMVGRGKPVWILFDEEPERFDAMYLFATEVFFSLDELLTTLKGELNVPFTRARENSRAVLDYGSDLPSPQIRYSDQALRRQLAELPEGSSGDDRHEDSQDFGG